MIDLVEVKLWGATVGALSWDSQRGVALFDYSEDFIGSGINPSPLNDIYGLFEGIKGETFKGLPSFIAESLPDKFGNAIIDSYFANKGVTEMSILDRLCYVGERGMGAFTFHPITVKSIEAPIELNTLVTQARLALSGNLDTAPQDAINEILSVGISAGGARAKAVIAFNKTTGEIKSGIRSYSGFTDYIIKFDGVSESQLGKSQPYGRIEYAYYLMARSSGINMMPSQLFKEDDRAHFLTERFDRVNGEKLHMLSLCGVAGLDFQMQGAHSYEQYFSVVKRLTNDSQAIEQAIKRSFFNILANNPDDHTKNVGFLMSKQGEWSLAPAYDMTYSFNNKIAWTHDHQMSLNGKTRDFTKDDLLTSAMTQISKEKAAKLLTDVRDAISKWSEFAEVAGLDHRSSELIGANHE